MEQVVYADVLWLIDFSMDLLALGLAGRIAQRAARPWRLCTAAALGGLWSVLALLFGIDGAGGLALDLALAAGMLLVAYGRMSVGRFALGFGGFFCSALLLGGSMTALANLLRPAVGESPSGSGFFLLALAGSGVTLLGTSIRRRAAPRQASVTVTFDGRSVSLDAMTDSGNLVRDPVSGRAVIFVSSDKLRVLLDGALLQALLAGRIEGMQALPPADARRLCLVPAATVQGRTMLLTLRPDAVEVEGEGCAALLAPMAERAGTYDAVLPAELCGAARGYITIGKKA